MNEMEWLRNHINDANNGQHGRGRRRRARIPSLKLAEISEFRRKEHTRRARDENKVQLAKLRDANEGANLPRDRDDSPVVRGRPYGLPEGMAVNVVWELIFKHVHDVEDIGRLRQTCTIFKDLLEQKYTFLRLIEVTQKFANQLGGVNTMLSLRRVCKASKTAVDKYFLKPTLDGIYWFPETYPDSSWWDQWIPKPELRMYSRESWLRPLRALLSSVDAGHFVPSDIFPLRRISVRECAGGQGLRDLRALFQRFLELAGNCVIYFEYISNVDSQETYNNLRRWAALMPNLENLTVEVHSEMAEVGDPLPENVEPFPALSKLTTYAEPEVGLRVPFLLEILRANPQICEILQAEHPMVHTLQEREVTEGLEAHQLRRFHYKGISHIPSNTFLEFRVQWPLKVLSLAVDVFEQEVSSRTLFGFVNQFGATLEDLSVSWKVRDNGGFLDLPKVSKVLWRLWPNLTHFEFMVPVGNLQYLDIDVVSCPQIIANSWEGVKAFVDDSKLSLLFPTMRQVRARMVHGSLWNIVWNN